MSDFDKLLELVVKCGCEEYGSNAMCDGDCFERCKDCIAAMHVESLVRLLVDSGEIIVMPCKIGTDVYNICDGNIQPMTVERHSLNEKEGAKAYAYCKDECEYCEYCCDRKGKDCLISFSCDDVGKTVFLSREEAEKVIKE